MNRRGFLKLTAGGIAAAIAAPYVITTPGLLMKVRAIEPLDLTVNGWLEECRKRVAESMAMDVERAMLYGETMTATEVIARNEEAFAIFGRQFSSLYAAAFTPPDIPWFTLKLKGQS